jgi:shikimate 5-dehydrogenase
MVEVTGRTRIWGILADPVGHVKTPQMINAVARTRLYIYRSKQLGDQPPHSTAKHHRQIPRQGISARIPLL